MNPKDITESFQRFWKAYPKRVAKGQAVRTWGKVGGDEHVEAILKDLRTRVWPAERQYIPHPSSYLSQWRWLDELEEDGNDGDW